MLGMQRIKIFKCKMKKNNVLYKNLKLPNIHPFVPKLVPGLGSSFKRSCIVEVLKEQIIELHNNQNFEFLIYHTKKD